MKKLMVLLAAVALAACSQAAVVQWGLSNTLTFDGSKLGGQSVSLYIVGINDAADVLIDTRSTAANPPVKKGQMTAGAGTAQDAYNYNSTLAGGALVDGSGADAGRQYYIVINYNDGTTDYTYTSSAVTSSGLSATSLGEVKFTVSDTIGAAGAKDAWVAVPEPTSGLLMLVGLGALALRRRRA